MRDRFRRFVLGKTTDDVDQILRYLVQQAAWRVPFYRECWAGTGANLGRFSGIRDLPTLPITEKRALLERDASERIFRSALRRSTIRRGTSGMSGGPIDVHMTRGEFAFRRLTLLSRMLHDAGPALPFRIVEAGAWVPPDARRDLLVQRFGPVTATYVSRILTSSEQLECVRHARPTLLTGCPTGLALLATEALRSGSRIRPKLVVSRGEVLRPDVRSLLCDAFACRVTDYYNAQEIGNIAWQCPDHPEMMHVNHDTCWLEIVDDDGMPVAAGVEGHVLVTNLFNATMPIIRYKLNDRAALLPAERPTCSCGSRRPTMSTPLGRDDDFILLPDDRCISPRLLDDRIIAAFRAVGFESALSRSVIQYQVVQVDRTRLTLRLTSHLPVPAAFRSAVETEIARLHPELTCDLEIGRIEPGETGKTRRVESRIGPRAS